MRIFPMALGLGLVLAVAACHPSDADKKDVREGIELGETGIPLSRLTRVEGIDTKSNYFKAGFDYGALKKANQAWRRMRFSKLGDFDNGVGVYPKDGWKYEVAMRRDLAAQLLTAWTELHRDLEAISMTPEAFGRLVGDDTLPALLAKKPSADF